MCAYFSEYCYEQDFFRTKLSSNKKLYTFLEIGKHSQFSLCVLHWLCTNKTSENTQTKVAAANSKYEVRANSICFSIICFLCVIYTISTLLPIFSICRPSKFDRNEFVRRVYYTVRQILMWCFTSPLRPMDTQEISFFCNITATHTIYLKIFVIHYLFIKSDTDIRAVIFYNCYSDSDYFQGV